LDATYLKLGDIAEIIPGIIGDKLHAGAYSYLLYQPNSYSDSGEIISIPTVFRNEPVPVKQIVCKGDVIVKRLNHEHVCLVAETEGESTVSHNLFIIRAKEGVCYPDYLAFLLEQQETVSQMAQVSGSAAPIRVLSVKMLREISMPLVPIERQRIIGALWNLTKRRQSLLKKLDSENIQLMTAIYYGYIVRGDD